MHQRYLTPRDQALSDLLDFIGLLAAVAVVVGLIFWRS